MPLDANGNASMYLSQAGLINAVAMASDTAGNVGTGQHRPGPCHRSELQHVSPSTDHRPHHEPVGHLPDRRHGNGPGHAPGVLALDYARADLVDLTNLAADNPNWVEINTGTGAMTAAKLGTFDPTILANDGYVIRLLAQNTNGLVSTQGVVVTVSGAAKLGNFHFSVTDLSVPLAGIPITITRSYDTLNAGTQGDFGYGWQLSTGNPDLFATVPDGELPGNLRRHK